MIAHHFDNSFETAHEVFVMVNAILEGERVRREQQRLYKVLKASHHGHVFSNTTLACRCGLTCRDYFAVASANNILSMPLCPLLADGKVVRYESNQSDNQKAGT